MPALVCARLLHCARGVEATENHSDGVDRSTLCLPGRPNIAM
jgi:hypothetical protein